MRAIFSIGRLPVFVGLLAAAGCGGNSDPNRPQVVPAGGVVTYQGQPIAEATVNFQPQEEGAQPAYGKTDAEGRFRLQTFEADDGAVPGQYQVSVTKIEIFPQEMNDLDPNLDAENLPPAPPPKSHLPDKYANPATSGLTATVVAGQDNEFPLELKD